MGGEMSDGEDGESGGVDGVGGVGLLCGGMFYAGWGLCG